MVILVKTLCSFWLNDFLNWLEGMALPQWDKVHGEYKFNKVSPRNIKLH